MSNTDDNSRENRKPTLSEIMQRNGDRSSEPYRAYCEASDAEKTRVRSLTEQERSRIVRVQFDDSGEYSKERDEFSDAMMIIMSVCDEHGALRFSEDQLQDVANLPAYITRPILEAANELNAAPDVDEAKKNSAKITDDT